MQNNLRDKVFRIVSKRNLCSYMNDTKWSELVVAVTTEMPFPPPYSIKYITQECAEISKIVTEDVTYWGDWIGENFPQEYYFNIEWLKVRLRYLKYRGRLIAHELVDESRKFEEILHKYNILFEEIDGLYCIYGYR